MFPLMEFMACFYPKCSCYITMSVCCIHYISKSNHVGFKWKGTSIKKMVSCCKLGVSAFVGEISSAVITIIFNMLLLDIAGNIGVAAYGVVANTSIVGMSIFNGLAQGVQPLMSESYGKRNGEQVKKLLQWGIRTCLAAEIIIVAFIWAKTDLVIDIFNSEQICGFLIMPGLCPAVFLRDS